MAFRTIEVLVVVPVQLPDQPVNVEPAAAAAVNVTLVLCAKLEVQVLPQEIPAGAEVTVPDPVPARVTVSVYWIGGGASEKFAVQDVERVASTTLTLAVVPAQLPDQWLKVEPLLGVAVSVTLLFLG